MKSQAVFHAKNVSIELAPREKKSLRLQTLLALKELGVVIGVFIMVAASFMLMVSTALYTGWFN